MECLFSGSHRTPNLTPRVLLSWKSAPPTFRNKLHFKVVDGESRKTGVVTKISMLGNVELLSRLIEIVAPCVIWNMHI
jgi:hypothetical protein